LGLAWGSAHIEAMPTLFPQFKHFTVNLTKFRFMSIKVSSITCTGETQTTLLKKPKIKKN